MNKLEVKDNLESISIVGIIAGVTCFILTYLTAYYWIRDGLDPFETSMLAIITAVYFFISVFLFNSFLLTKYNRLMTKEGVKKLSGFYQVCLTLLVGFLTFLTLDAFIYYFVDDTIPIKFTESLLDLVGKTGGDISELEDFGKLTFALQNGILTFSLGLVAAFFSLLPIKAFSK